MALPIFKKDDKDFMLLQTNWAQQLNPLLVNPSLQSILLKNVTVNGTPTAINHLLGRKLQGWRVVRLRANTTVFEPQQSTTPNLTFYLQTGSGSATVVDIEVF